MLHSTTAAESLLDAPDDETYAKFDFYAAHHVDELIVVDPQDRTIQSFRLTAAYVNAPSSQLLDLPTSDLTTGVEWPTLH